MQPRTRWQIAAGAAAVVAAGAVTLAVWIPSDEELAARASHQLTEALGAPVQVGSVHWSLLPVPVVVAENIVAGPDQDVVLQRITGWPRLGRLLRAREIAFERVELQGARIPQVALAAFDRGDGAGKAADQGTDTSAPSAEHAVGRFRLAALPVERFVFRDLVWIGRRGIPLEFDGTVDFDPEWRPRHAEVARPGVEPPAKLVLEREGAEDRWRADVVVGGGTWNGTLALQQRDGGSYRIDGQFTPRGVGVEDMLASFKRKSVIWGAASGQTTLVAEGRTMGEIARSAHTTTRFRIAPARVLRFDLDKAIRSAGQEHDGETRLDVVEGQVDTQNTRTGMVVRYRDVKATSGALSATGSGVIENRQINAEFAVDLVDGIVGVPLKVTGHVEQPKFSVPAGAVAGAAVGTAVLPGIGTAIGARIGGALERIFGGEPERPNAPAQRPPAGGPRSR